MTMLRGIAAALVLALPLAAAGAAASQPHHAAQPQRLPQGPPPLPAPYPAPSSALGPAPRHALAPPPDVSPPPPRPMTWEDIPENIRLRMERRVAPAGFQAVVRRQADPIDPSPRMVEPGSRLATQMVSPAFGARLLDAPARPALGAAGSALWRADDDQKVYWCRLGERSLLRPANLVYCFRDLDDDGAFERVHTLELTGADTFQSFAPGQGAIIEKPLRYEAAPPPARAEIVAVVYDGVIKGEIDQTDHLRQGVVRFSIQYGDPSTPLHRKTLNVALDETGSASGLAPTGQFLWIDQVEVGGRARIRVVDTPRSDESLVMPATTRESLLEELRLRLQFGR